MGPLDRAAQQHDQDAGARAHEGRDHRQRQLAGANHPAQPAQHALRRGGAGEHLIRYGLVR